MMKSTKTMRFAADFFCPLRVSSETRWLPIGEENRMRGSKGVRVALMIALAVVVCTATTRANIVNYGSVNLSSAGSTDSGNFSQVWDLTACDMVLRFTYDARGLSDAASAHAWAALGIRDTAHPSNFNPTWSVEGAGVWLATDFDWSANTFAPDAGSPNQDLDDKLLLQKAGGHGEGDYNLPGVPPNGGNNHRFWFDRDGVDPYQALSPLAVDGGTYNTQGLYDIVIMLHATGLTTGTAYMTINGLNQGFETDGNWNTMELTPAGMTFTGDMTAMQVYYGLYGYGATHTVAFNDITVEGCLAVPEPMSCVLFAGSVLGGLFIRRRRTI